MKRTASTVPVCGPDGRLTGIVALDDVLAMCAEQLEAAANVVAAERVREETIRGGH